MREAIMTIINRSVLSVTVPVLFLMLLALGCSTISVHYDYDTKADFASLKTYDWLPIPVKVYISTLSVERIKNAVDNQLEAKGLKRTSENPDFLIAAHIEIKEKVSVIDLGYYYVPYNRHWGGYWVPGGVSRYRYKERTLILDFVYAESKKMFWRGVATAELDERLTPEKREKKINETVGKIFKKYPPFQNK